MEQSYVLFCDRMTRQGDLPKPRNAKLSTECPKMAI